MGCECCLKFLLIFINVIFGIVGTLFLAVGVFLYVGLVDIVEPMLESAFDEVTGLGSTLGVKSFDSSGSFDINELTKLLDPLAIVFIVIGCLLLVMVILCCVGACCKIKVVLYVYAAILLALFLAQLVIFCLYFTGALEDKITASLTTQLVDKYVGTDDYGFDSIIWNVLHYALGCCGVTGYTDFHSCKQWNRNRVVDVSGVDVNVVLMSPLSCCKSTTSDSACATVPTPANNYYNVGCWAELNAVTDKYQDIAIGVVAGILVLQLLCAICAIVIAIKMRKKGE